MPKSKKTPIFNMESAPIALEKLGFDPLQESMKIAAGEGIGTVHPFLEILEKELGAWVKFCRDGKGVSHEHISQFIETARNWLGNSYVSPEIRSRHTLELLSLTHGKKKQLEDVEIDPTAGEVKKLTHAEVTLFMKKLSKFAPVPPKM